MGKYVDKIKFYNLQDSKAVRVLEKPNIKPLYLNVSESREEMTTMYGRFRCPLDTTVAFGEGTIVKFDKVSNSEENSTVFELVLYYDTWRYQPKFLLQSKSASEALFIYLKGRVEHSTVQTEFSGTNCSVAINRSSKKQSTTYTSVVQNCDQNLNFSNFRFWLDKSGRVLSIPYDNHCKESNTEEAKYFESVCSSYVSNDPLNVTFYEDKMAAENVKLIHFAYKFQPAGPCTDSCLTDIKQWFFSII
ncbi:uncharacterized protein LOC133194401 [Saccostrea echinata]|uniref:uncharacterized protein LOC133194401 n=1 Tax=Saccostrea echinata TaxID=191078 RepID=UPI002A8087D1|nr:uncharacterized protein LOC133194401 [Saccostrea echinata]